MSINHIIDGVVPEDELLNVHFDVIRCNNMDNEKTGGAILALDKATTGTPLATAGITNITCVPTSVQRIGASILTGFQFFITMPTPALSEFYIDAPYADGVSQLYGLHPEYAANFNTTGYANIYGTQTLDLKGHHFSLISSEPAPGNETTHLRMTFQAWGDTPATTGGFVLYGKVCHQASPVIP